MSVPQDSKKNVNTTSSAPQKSNSSPTSIGAQSNSNYVPPNYAQGKNKVVSNATPQSKATGKRVNPNSTQNVLEIGEVRDGIVILNDGSFRSVIMVKSINFDLMSPEEKESVEYAYQGFLNSLYFPIQIFINSRRVDIKPYIDKLDRLRQEEDNMLLALLMQDYVQFMANLAQQTNIMDKDFFIIIPYSSTEKKNPISQSKGFFTGIGDLFNTKEKKVVINETDLKAAEDELRNRVVAVLDGLKQINVEAIPLDTEELIELYYNIYNPDTAVREQLKKFDDLEADVIQKGKGNAPQPNLDRETV